MATGNLMERKKPIVRAIILSFIALLCSSCVGENEFASVEFNSDWDDFNCRVPLPMAADPEWVTHARIGGTDINRFMSGAELLAILEEREHKA